MPLTLPNPPRWPLLIALVILAIAPLLSGCESCNTRRLRRLGSTCGQNNECAGGVCYRGRCTKSCSSNSDCGGGICIESICQLPDDDFDGDGLSNAVELKIGTSTVKADTDDDGIADKAEVGSTATPKDSNGDGVPDALQSNILDADGDCMVDAIDVAPSNPAKANLPTAAQFCFVGVCGDHLAEVEVVCRKANPTYDGVVLGCVGCGCAVDTAIAPDFQPKETACDGLDNDCDGQTDEDMLFAGKGLGQSCSGLYGICAYPGPDGLIPIGVVECGSDKTVTCSVHGNGSASVGKDETCNGADDDCDGVTDELFSWSDGGKALPVGAACSCGAKVLSCGDGSPATDDKVACAGDGASASCNRLPHDNDAILVDSGGPQPRLRWTAAAPAGWQRLVVVSGAIPGAKAMVARDEAWSLPLSTTATAWELTEGIGPGARDGAALVWDADGDRLLLVGGSGEAGKVDHVWALSKAGAWTDLSGAEISAGRILPLPDGIAGTAVRGVVIGVNDSRKLVVFPDGKTPLWAPLTGTSPQWVPVQLPSAPAGVSGLATGPGCVAEARLPSGSSATGVAIALSTPIVGAQLGLYRVHDDGTKPIVTYLASTNAPPGRREFGCALAPTGPSAALQLHVVGGHALGGVTETAHESATFDAPLLQATAATWAAQPTPPSFARRSGATLLATETSLTIVGGHQVLAGSGGTQLRQAVRSVERLSTGGGTTRLDVQTPAPRIGAAWGRWQGHGVCMVGGVTFDLPDVGAASARVRPVTDAHCIDTAGAWSVRGTDLPPWAFGIGGVDHATGKAILAGGVDFSVSGRIASVWRIWSSELNFNTATPGDRPLAQAAVHSVDLASGSATTASAPGPEVALPSVVYDPRRRRTIAFGGISDSVPVDAFWSYDHVSGQWTDHAKDYAAGNRPLPGYGSLVSYSPEVDELFIVGGAVYNNDAGVIKGAHQFVNEAVLLDACSGVDASLTWVVPTLSTPVFLPRPALAYGDTSSSPPQHPLLRRNFGVPAWTPILFDPVGNEGVMALQDPGPYAAVDASGQPCPSSATKGPLLTPVRATVSLGRCDGKAKVFLNDEQPLQLPPHLVMGASVYHDEARTHWIYEGVAPDGALVGRTWTLAQACQPGAP